MWTHLPSEPHRRTIILLHGRGDTGPNFAVPFLKLCPLSDEKTFVEHFPDTKFICPTAEERPAKAFGGESINQWFEITSLKIPDLEEYNQTKGLSESVRLVHSLIEEEEKLLGDSERIYIGGLSQGCATMLHALLTLDKPLGGCFGMSGWFPFVAHVRSTLDASSTESGAGSAVEQTSERVKRVLAFLRDNLGVQSLNNDSSAVLDTPIWIGHGDDDWVIDYHLGDEIQETLGMMEMKVEFKKYVGLTHWYKVPEELDDIANFIKRNSS